MRQLLINSDLLDSRILSSVYGTLELFMTGNLNLKEDSPPFIFLNPGGANRFVNMPPLERGMSYRISHIGVANTITVRDANNNTIVSLAASEVVDLTASAAVWTFIAGSNETGTGGGGGLSNAYVALTDGSASAVAVGGDTIKFRVGSLLTGVVTNDDVTHGDNVLFSHASYPALSVLANPTNASALPTTLASGVNGDVLWRSGSSLIFGPLAFGTVGLTGQLPIANGGTAGGSSQAAINNIGQLTTIGDILFHNGTNHTRFPRGSDGQVLTAQTATGLAWANANAHSHTSADISDFAEAVDDRIGTGLFQDSNTIDFIYTDVSNTMTGQLKALTGDVTSAQDNPSVVVNRASSAFAFTGIISDLGLAVSQNNYNPTGLAGATTIRISSTGPIDITGLAGGAAGRLMVLQNVGTQAITLKNLSGSSSAGNQFALNNDIGLSTNQTVALLYDATTTKWRATGAPSPAGSLTDGNKGDITVGSSGADFQINAGAVGFPEMVDIVTDSLIGRDTAGTGDPENITLNATLSMTGTGQLQRAALTGDVTANAGSNTTSIANNIVTFAKMQDIASDRLIGRDTAASGDPEEISVDSSLEFTGALVLRRAAITGDVTIPTNSNAATIPNNTVTYAKIQDISATQRVVGRNTVGAGDPEEVTVTQVLDWIGSTRGSVLYRGAAGWAALTPGTSGFALTSQGVGADPIWTASSAVVADGDKGDITITGGVWAIDPDVVTYAKMQNISAASLLLGRGSAGGAGDPEEITLGTNLSMSGTTLNATGGGGTPGGANTQVQFNDSGAFGGDADLTWDKTNNILALATGGAYAFSTDVFLRRDAANILAQRNGATAQALRIYNTFTDASNYERWGITWNANQCEIGLEVAGTGTVTNRPIVFKLGSAGTNQGVYFAGTPTPTVWTQGITSAGFKNGAGTFYGWTPSGNIASNQNTDTAIERASAGVVMTTDGNSSLRDLKSRNIEFTGNLEVGNVSDTTITRTGAGQIAVEGVAVAMAGKQTIYVPAASMQSRASAGAQSTTRAINSITVPVQAFDATSAEGVQFSVAFPKSWNNGTITYQAFWTAVASSGTAILALKGGCFADNVSINITGLGTAVTVTDTFQNADRVHVSPESAAVTLSNAAADTMAFFDLVRDISDTLTVDLELIGIKFYYTTNAGNDA